MKMHELNSAELTEVNGGSLLSSGGPSSQSGIAGMLGIGNILSFSQASQNGDDAQASSFSFGNGISSSLGGIFSQLSQ